jgi:hypothetical protein
MRHFFRVAAIAVLCTVAYDFGAAEPAPLPVAAYGPGLGVSGDADIRPDLLYGAALDDISGPVSPTIHGVCAGQAPVMAVPRNIKPLRSSVCPNSSPPVSYAQFPSLLLGDYPNCICDVGPGERMCINMKWCMMTGWMCVGWCN